MKKVKFKFLLSLALICTFCFVTTACGVVPAAWVQLKTDGGYVVYTTDMYANVSSHIYYYASEEDATNTSNSMIEIYFSPRILGPDEINGTKTTVIDISSSYMMFFIVKKSSAIYSETKGVYLNGADTALTPVRVTDGESTVMYEFKDFGLVRGNPNGHTNDFINTIEYK